MHYSPLVICRVMIVVMAYVPIVRAEEPSSGEEPDLELEELFNVKVTVASKKAESISDAPGVTYVVSNDEIKSSGAITLKEILTRVPSIGLATSALTNRSLPVMRGDLTKTNSSHILFLLNGRPVREVQEGGVNSDFIESFPVDIIEHVEVIRGPGSVLYGSDAFSGVVNVITKRVENDTPAVSLTAHYEPASGGGSTASIRLKAGDANIVASGRYYQKPDWSPEYMKMSWAPTDQIDPATFMPIYLPVDSVYKNDIIHDKGPGVFVDIDYNGISLTGLFVDWTSSAFQTLSDVKSQKYFGNLGYKTAITDIWKTEINATGIKTGLLVDNPDFVKRISHSALLENTHVITLFSNVNVVTGGTVSYIDGRETYLEPKNRGERPYDVSEGKRWAFSGYGQIDYSPRDLLKIIGGIQANKTSGVEKHIAPRAGIILHPKKGLTFKALYSEAFRLPSINELFMDFDIGLYGDKNLRPEIVKTTDIGISYQNEWMMAGLNYFYSKQEDIIQQVLFNTAQGDYLSRKYTNLDDMSFSGIEFETKLHPLKSLLLNGSLTYQDNKGKVFDKTSYNILPVASLLIKGGASYMHPCGITVSLFDAYQGGVPKEYNGYINNSDTSVNDYDHIDNGPFHMINFSSQFNIARLFDRSWKVEPSFLFKIDNLAGKEIWMYEYGGFSNDVFPTLRGREFFVGFNLTY